MKAHTVVVRSEDMTARIEPRWRRRVPWLIAGILALTVVALVVRPWGRAERPGDPRPARPAVAVEIATAEAVRLEETVRGVGTLRASAQVELRPEIPGVVRAIRFTEGTEVQRGQVLFELDDEALVGVMAARQAALRSAETAVEDARRTVERARLLWQRELIARADLGQAETTLARAVAERDRLRAELAVAQSQRRESRVLAPFTGVISERNVDRGAYVTAGQTLASLYQVDPLDLELYLSERHLGQVRPGQPVAVTIAAFSDRVFDGRVDFVSPVVREATRDFLVKAAIPNRDGGLRPGAFATARVTVDVRAARPVVPEEALVATRVGYRVFVVDDGFARASATSASGCARTGSSRSSTAWPSGSRWSAPVTCAWPGENRCASWTTAPPRRQGPQARHRHPLRRHRDRSERLR